MDELDITERIDVDEITEELTGRGDGLRKSKPDADGLTQYVWRMCRFHAGYDTSMPVTAAWWLQYDLHDRGIEAKVSGVKDDAGEQIVDDLDDVVDEVLANLGESRYEAAKRWKGSLY